MSPESRKSMVDKLRELAQSIEDGREDCTTVSVELIMDERVAVYGLNVPLGRKLTICLTHAYPKELT